MPNSMFPPPSLRQGSSRSATWDICRVQDAATLRGLADELESLPAPTALDLSYITWMLHSVIRGLFIFKVSRFIPSNTLLFRGSRERRA